MNEGKKYSLLVLIVWILRAAALTGSAGLVFAQVINVDTRMNILGNVKCSISLWRAVKEKKKKKNISHCMGKDLVLINLVSTEGSPETAQVASSTASASSEML